MSCWIRSKIKAILACLDHAMQAIFNKKNYQWRCHVTNVLQPSSLRKNPVIRLINVIIIEYCNGRDKIEW